MVCGKLVTCWDYLKRPCLRESGHFPGHCNPFSSDYHEEEKQLSSEQLYEQVLQAAGLSSKNLAA